MLTGYKEDAHLCAQPLVTLEASASEYDASSRTVDSLLSLSRDLYAIESAGIRVSEDGLGISFVPNFDARTFCGGELLRDETFTAVYG